MIFDGGEGNFVIFQLDHDYFIQLAAPRGAFEMYCEAVCDNYLDDSQKLSQEQKDTLLKLGWLPPETDEDNYKRGHKVDSEKSREDLARILWTTAQYAYHSGGIDERKINLNLE